MEDSGKSWVSINELVEKRVAELHELSVIERSRFLDYVIKHKQFDTAMLYNRYLMDLNEKQR